MANMHKWIKKMCLGILIVPAFFLVILLIGCFYLKTDHAQHLIQSVINRRIPGAIHWEIHTLSILGGVLDLQNLRINGPRGNQCIYLNRIKLNLAWLAVFSGEVRLSELHLLSPEVFLEIGRDGRLNLSDVFVSGGPKKEKKDTPVSRPLLGKSFSVDELVLSNGKITYKNPRRTIQTNIEHISFSSKINLALDTAQLSISGRDLILHYGERKEKLDQLELDIHYANHYIAVDRAVFKKDSIVIRANGSIDNLQAEPVFDIRSEASAVLPDVLNLFGISDGSASGGLNVVIRISGMLTSPELLVSLDLKNAIYKGVPLRTAQIEGSFKDRIVTFQSADLQSANGKIHLDGTIDLQPLLTPNFRLAGPARVVSNAVGLDLNGTVDGDLAEITQAMRVGTDMTGRVTHRLMIRETLGNPQITLWLSVKDGTAYDASFREASMSLRLKEHIVDVEKISVASSAGNLNVTGKIDLRRAFLNGFVHPKRKTTQLSYAFTIDSENIDFSCIPSKVPLMGVLSGVAELSGSGISLSNLKADMVCDLAVNDFGILSGQEQLDITLKGHAVAKEGNVTVHNMRLETDDSEIIAEGNVAISRKTIDIDASAKTGDLKRVLDKLGVGLDITTDSCYLSADVTGYVSRPNVAARFTGKNVRYRTIEIGDVNTDAALDSSGKLHVNVLRVQNRSSRIEGSGDVQLYSKDIHQPKIPPVSGRLSFDSVQPSHFFTETAVTGVVNGSVALSGELKMPRISVILSGSGLAVGQCNLGDVSLAARFYEGRVAVDSLQLQNERSALSVSGMSQLFSPNSFRMLSDPSFNLNVTSEEMALNEFFNGYTGHVELDASINGTFRHPRGSVRAYAYNIETPFQNIREILLNLTMDGESIRVNPLALYVTPTDLIRVAGWVGMDRTFALKLSGKDIAVKHLDKLQHLLDSQGNIQLDMAAEGSFDNPQMAGSLRATQLVMAGKAIDDIVLDVSLKDSQARLSGIFNGAIQGAYHLKSKDFNLAVNVDNMMLTPYLRITGTKELRGRLSGIVNASGNLAAYDDIHATANISAFELYFKDKRLVSSNLFQAELHQQKIYMPNGRFFFPEQGFLDIQGAGDTSGRFRMDFNGYLPVRIAAMFTEYAQTASGAVRVQGQCSGTVADPEFQADLHLEDIGVTIAETDQKLHDVNGRVSITEKRLVFSDIAGYLDDGEIGIDGELELDRFRPGRAKLNIKTQFLPIMIPGSLDLVSEMNLRIAGTPEKTVTDGNIILIEGLYYKDVEINKAFLNAIKEKRRPKSSASPEKTLPYLKNMALNIGIKHRDLFIIDNDIAMLLIRPDLTVNGTFNHPVINGRVEVETSDVEITGVNEILFQDNVFKVTKGIITFLNPYKTQPVVDIESHTTVTDNVQEWDITLNISGPPDDLLFTLSSDPEEDEADIISLLATGQKREKFGQQKTSLEKTLAGLISKRLGDNIKKETGLDIFEIAYEEDDSSVSNSTMRLVVGKKVSPRITIKYDVDSTASDIIQRVLAEYKLFEHVVLEMSQKTGGIHGGKIRYRIDIR